MDKNMENLPPSVPSSGHLEIKRAPPPPPKVDEIKLSDGQKAVINYQEGTIKVGELTYKVCCGGIPVGGAGHSENVMKIVKAALEQVGEKLDPKSLASLTINADKIAYKPSSKASGGENIPNQKESWNTQLESFTSIKNIFEKIFPPPAKDEKVQDDFIPKKQDEAPTAKTPEKTLENQNKKPTESTSSNNQVDPQSKKTPPKLQSNITLKPKTEEKSEDLSAKLKNKGTTSPGIPKNIPTTSETASTTKGFNFPINSSTKPETKPKSEEITTENQKKAPATKTSSSTKVEKSTTEKKQLEPKITVQQLKEFARTHLGGNGEKIDEAKLDQVVTKYMEKHEAASNHKAWFDGGIISDFIEGLKDNNKHDFEPVILGDVIDNNGGKLSVKIGEVPETLGNFIFRSFYTTNKITDLNTIKNSNDEVNYKPFVVAFAHAGHFLTVYIDSKKRTVEYYDSMGSYLNKTNIGDQLKELANDLGYKYDNKTEDTVSSKLQEDSYACGSWTCFFLEKRLNDPDFKPNNITRSTKEEMIHDYRLNGIHSKNIAHLYKHPEI
jgi:hypothetical protein